MKQRPVRRAYILILIVLSILAVLFGFKYILPLFFPFVLGYFLAWLAAPIVTFLEVRLRIPRGIASFLVVSTFLFVLVVSLYFILRTALHQLLGLITNLPVYQQLVFLRMGGICSRMDSIFGLDAGTCYVILVQKFGGLMNLIQTNLLPSETGQAIDLAKVCFHMIWNAIILFISALLFVKEFSEYKEEFRSSCFYKEIHMVTGVLSNMGIAYLKAQFILMCITAAICIIGVILIGNHYAILIGVGIAIFDAFPVLGSAFILIPWAIVCFLKKEILSGVILLVTFLICQFVRQILEPKLVGDRIGVRPVYTLISMYVGLKIYGGWGFILGPISLVAIQAIVRAGIAHLRGDTQNT